MACHHSSPNTNYTMADWVALSEEFCFAEKYLKSINWSDVGKKFDVPGMSRCHENHISQPAAVNYFYSKSMPGCA